MSVVLEIGPGETFLFDSPGGTTTNNLPEGLRDLEAGVGPGRPIQAIYSLSFGCNGAYVLAARNANGAIIRRNNLPPQLESWLIDSNVHTCKRDIATLIVEFGPNGSFYARDKDSYRWHNLPDALEEAIQQRLCPAGWMARPDFIRLGADGAFIYSNDCGGCSHALGNYPKLQELILWLQRSNVGGLTGFGLVQSISISLHRPGQFILLLNSRQHFAELSPTATQALNSMASTFPARHLPPQQAAPQRAVSQPLSTTSPPPVRYATLPIRKPVGSAAGQARPPPQHLVSSPIPQAQPSRPVSYAQTSAPAVPQVQNQAARPVSMQVPGRVTSAQQQINNANFNFTYNTSSNANYSTTNPDTNNGGTTYVVATDGGTASPPPTYVAPYYPVDVSSNSTVVETSSSISSPPPTYVAPYYPVDVSANSTIVDNSSNVYDTTANSTIDNSSYTSANIVDSNSTTSATETDVYSATVVDTSSNVYDASSYNTTTDDTTTYTTTTDSTTYDASTGDTTSYDVTSTTVDDTVVTNSSGTGGDSGGFWSALLS